MNTEIVQADFSPLSSKEWNALLNDTGPFGSFDARHTFTKQVGWYILTRESLHALFDIRKGKRVVDLGCGSGYLVWCLRKLGVAADGIDLRDQGYEYTEDYIDDIRKEDYLQVDLSGYDVVILAWPPYAEPVATQVAMRIQDHQLFIYQGEGWGGCTGDDMFHEVLEGKFTEQEDLSDALNKHHVQWDGIHDSWMVYRRNQPLLEPSIV